MRQEAIDDSAHAAAPKKRTVKIRTASLAILQFSICAALSLAYLVAPRPTVHHVIWFVALPAFLVGSAVIGHRIFRVYQAERLGGKAHVAYSWIPWTPWLLVLSSAMAIPLARLNAAYSIAMWGAIFVIVTFAIARRSALWRLQNMRLEYVPPRVALFRAAFSGIVTVRSGTPLGALSILSGMVGAALIITQIFVFFASWLIIEVAGPVLDLIICGPFRWFTWVVSCASSPIRRYSLAIVWTAIGAMPGLAITIAAAWLIHRF